MSCDLVDRPAQPIFKLPQFGGAVPYKSAKPGRACGTQPGIEEQEGRDRRAQKHEILPVPVNVRPLSACAAPNLVAGAERNFGTNARSRTCQMPSSHLPKAY